MPAGTCTLSCSAPGAGAGGGAAVASAGAWLHRPRGFADPRGAASAVRCGETSFADLDNLWATIQERKANMDDKTSWTARLLSRGPDKCAQKVGEEATEICIEAAGRRKHGVVTESADLLYHLLVLWTSLGVDPADVFAELKRREGTSGVSEKASRAGRKI